MNLSNTGVILDTNVLMKPRVSDVIMDMRLQGLMAVHWTREIDREFLKNMVEVYQLEEAAVQRRLAAMKRRCPEWEIFLDSEVFVPEDVDKKDRHVAAAALVLRSKTDEDPSYDVILVTDNVKDLAQASMARLAVKVMASGDFLNAAYASNPDEVQTAIEKAVSDLKKPPYTIQELLFALKQQGANTLVDGLARKLGLSLQKNRRGRLQP